MADKKKTNKRKTNQKKANQKNVNQKNVNQKSNNNSNLLIITAAIILCVAVSVTIFVNKQKKETEKTDNDNVQVISEGGSLVIPISDISSTASFYPVEVDGTRMEVLAVADSQGNIRTAFNTCQICYGSGHGYYVQSGDVLICQNCGNQFTVEQVEIQSGGCNPWPIFPKDKTVADDTIEISYDFLNESKEIFANWKTQY